MFPGDREEKAPGSAQRKGHDEWKRLNEGSLKEQQVWARSCMNKKELKCANAAGQHDQTSNLDIGIT